MLARISPSEVQKTQNISGEQPSSNIVVLNYTYQYMLCQIYTYQYIMHAYILVGFRRL